MRKLIFIFAISCLTLQSIGQKSNSMIGYSSIDEKGVVANSSLAVKKALITVGLQSDGYKMLSISLGLNLSKSKTKMFLLPGFVWDYGKGILSYTGALLFTRESEKGAEIQFLLKGIKNLSKGDFLKLRTETEFLFGKRLKFGPFLEGEFQKEPGLYQNGPIKKEVTFSDFYISFGARSKWTPKFTDKFSLICYAGMQNINREGRQAEANIYYHPEKNFIWGAGLTYKF